MSEAVVRDSGIVQYELTYRDYTSAARAGFRSRAGFLAAIYGGILSIIFAVSLLGNYSSGVRAPGQLFFRSFSEVIPILIMTVIIYLGMYYVIMPFSIKRSLVGSRVIPERLTFHWNSSGVRAETARGETRYAWSDFLRVQHTNDAILLYYSRNCALVIPNRAFSAVSDLREFEQCISAHLTA